MGLLKNLTNLYIDGCNKREPVNNSWFSSITSWVPLKTSPGSTRFLPNSISSLQCLTVLRARDCNISDGDIPVEIGSLSSLKTLDLGSNIFCFLPDSLSLLSKLERLVVDDCRSLQSFPKLPPNVKFVDMNHCTSVERLPDLSNVENYILFHLQNCSSLAESHDTVNFNTVKRLWICRHSNLVRNFVDSLSQVHNEHAGLPGPIRNKNISSPLFDIPATTEKKRTCSILFDIPPTTEKKYYYELKFLAVYEAKTEGSVSTRITKVLDPHKASRYQWRFCFSHFKTRNCGNHSLVSRIPLGYRENEIVGGERIEVCFEIAPSACIVVKMCQVQLFHGTPNTRDFSIDKIHGHKIGFDLVESSSGLANKDYDSKWSSVWEDEDLMINNKRDTEYIHLIDDKLYDRFIIERRNTAQVLEDVDRPYYLPGQSNFARARGCYKGRRDSS